MPKEKQPRYFPETTFTKEEIKLNKYLKRRVHRLDKTQRTKIEIYTEINLVLHNKI